MEANRALPLQIRFAMFAITLALLPARPAPSSAQAATGTGPVRLTADSAAVSAPSAPRVVAGCADGERDADAEHNSRGHVISGLLTGPIGVAFAARSNPKPHGPRVATLAPQSAAEYERCYGRRARRRNLQSAIQGFAITTFTAITINYFIEAKTAP